MLSKFNIKESIAPIIYGEKEVNKFDPRYAMQYKRCPDSNFFIFFYFSHTHTCFFGFGLRIL
ncbi:MAG: hypothetical protein ACI8RD_006252 [Bacillariaceae sp.]|jgi:hypothetical protein